jgi:hypothetical protein
VLYVSLVLSAIFLLVVNLCAWLPRRLVTAALVIGLGFSILPMFLGIFFPPVALQFLLVSAAVLFWRWRSGNPWSFLTLSISATVVTYVVVLCLTLPEERTFARLRERFSYESMEERLPTPRSPRRGERLPRETHERLTLLENTVRQSGGGQGFFSRASMLQRLHEQKVSLFVNSPGFGVARILGRPSESRITGRLRPNTPIPQPDSSASPSGPIGDPSPTQIGSKSEGHGLRLLHREGVVDFAYPFGFGYVKDRRHVAGFQAHRFSEVPGPAEEWEVRRLDLVGLLLHDQPVVYVSENLPRMDELRGAPTRPLDRFEASALEKLRHGEELLIANAPNGVRMLGAIRSVQQCVTCHGGERGDLLGAFSYTLRRGGR